MCGKRAANAHDENLSRLFPDAAQLFAANLEGMGMPRARKATLTALAAAAVRDPRLFEPAPSLEHAVARLRAIPGVGEWTAHYIALRALHETDAFPAADAGLLRTAEAIGIATTPKALVARADAWRPWRAYAAQHLWAGGADEHWIEKEVAHG
jgi:3-methyladenine DNA glycosylase/8-oxoguanine DNA glycosylase